MESINILGVKVNTGMNFEQILCEIDKLLKDNKCHYICTTNAEFIIDSQKDIDFKNIINNSDISVPDGSGILFAEEYMKIMQEENKGVFYSTKAFIQGIKLGYDVITQKKKLGERISGVELMDAMCAYAQKNNLSVFLLGGWPKDKWGRQINTNEDLAQITATKLKDKYKYLKIIGATSQFSPYENDDEKSLQYIRKCMKEYNIDSLDLLFVAYGHPKQEKWIVRNMEKIPARVSMGVGGTFDYITHTQKRSPAIFINYNVEWLYKLFTQPWRFRRIIKAFPTFPVYVYKSMIRQVNNLDTQ